MEHKKMLTCKKCGTAILHGNFCVECLSKKEKKKLPLPPNTPKIPAYNGPSPRGAPPPPPRGPPGGVAPYMMRGNRKCSACDKNIHLRTRGKVRVLAGFGRNYKGELCDKCTKKLVETFNLKKSPGM